MKRILTILLLSLSFYASSQDPCAVLVSPMQGETDVRLDATISWSEVPGVNGYLLSIGTAPGSNNILNNEMVGSVTSYTPEIGLPPQTTIYVTIAPFYFDRPSVACPAQTFVTGGISGPPECTQLNTPADGAVDIEYTPSMTWDYAYGATGYFISAGTTPGGTNYLDRVDVGNFTGFTFTNILPPETTIYVRIIPYNDFGVAEDCPETSFITRPPGSVPGCTFLTSPMDGARNVALTTKIDWEPEADATGYIVNMGYTPGANDILEDAVFIAPTASVLDFLPNSNVYVTIIPFNDAGEATGCITESFTTTAGCGPFTDQFTGEVIDLNPRINLPDTLAFCGEENITPIEGLDPDLQYTWYLETGNGIREVGNQPFLNIEEPGDYFVEITDTIQQENNLLECIGVEAFTVVISDPPRLTGVEFTETPSGIGIEVAVAGNGDYEYAINSETGPYSPTPEFNVAEQESYTLYVREALACGITSFQLNPVSFPNFFTPNGDSFNDTWKPTIIGAMQPDLVVVHIFDRYGKLLKSLGPDDPGWNGIYNGRDLPASDYWYRAEFDDGSLKKGHFTLKR